MLTDEDKWHAVEDIRIRHKELVALIYLTDKQALSLLGLYLTAGAAAASAAFAGLGSSTVIPTPVSAALASAALLLFIGGVFCFFAMKPADIELAGRDAEFWTWADRPDVSMEGAFSAYFENCIATSAANRALNEKMARTLARGKLCGLLVPSVALLVGGAALFSGL